MEFPLTDRAPSPLRCWPSAFQTAEVAVGTTILGQAEFTQRVERSVVCAWCSADLVIDVNIRTQQGTSSDNPAVLNKAQIDIIDVSIKCVKNDAKSNDASLPVALSKDALLLVAKKEEHIMDRDRDYEHELSQETLVMGSDDIAKYEDLVEAACKPEKDDDDRRTGEPAVGGNGMRNRSRSPRAASNNMSIKGACKPEKDEDDDRRAGEHEVAEVLAEVVGNGMRNWSRSPRTASNNVPDTLIDDTPDLSEDTCRWLADMDI